MVRPSASSRRNSSQVAQRGTRLRVGDQHPGRLVVGAEHADRLAALDQQRLVVLQPPERGDDRARSTAQFARRLAAAAVDDQVLGPLGDRGVEVVHQHPQRGLLVPALAGERGAGRRVDGAERGSSRHGCLPGGHGCHPEAAERLRCHPEGAERPRDLTGGVWCHPRARSFAALGMTRSGSRHPRATHVPCNLFPQWPIQYLAMTRTRPGPVKLRQDPSPQNPTRMPSMRPWPRAGTPMPSSGCTGATSHGSTAWRGGC